MQTLKVSTQQLRTTANEFNTVRGDIQRLTNEMTNTVKQMAGNVWTGDAATKYKNKFNSLNDDIQRMLKMIEEHVKDLNAMAANYEKAESSNESASGSLPINPIS